MQYLFLRAVLEHVLLVCHSLAFLLVFPVFVLCCCAFCWVSVLGCCFFLLRLLRVFHVAHVEWSVVLVTLVLAECLGLCLAVVDLNWVV